MTQRNRFLGIRTLAVIGLAMLVLTGCDAGTGAPGTPNSLSAHLNGQMAVGFGTWR